MGSGVRQCQTNQEEGREREKAQVAGAEEAADKGMVLAISTKRIPQGLKPTSILQHLRHD
jgi:hypothetical protein